MSPDATITCPTCRRAVTPKRGPIGAACPRCGGFLPSSPSRPRTAPRSLPAAEEVQLGPAMAAAANAALAEAAKRMTSVRHYARLHELAAEEVRLAYQADADNFAAEAQARERAQVWREALPNVAAAMGCR